MMNSFHQIAGDRPTPVRERSHLPKTYPHSDHQDRFLSCCQSLAIIKRTFPNPVPTAQRAAQDLGLWL
ncbi:MAG: hypothetical protein AAF327_02070 [Cyanobacteria bacterium P01_A01_bin.37]